MSEQSAPHQTSRWSCLRTGCRRIWLGAFIRFASVSWPSFSAPEDMTPLLFGVLVAVLEQPREEARNRWRMRMGVDVVNFGQMIDELEGKGLVERKIDPDDRRARKLYVTERGAAVAPPLESRPACRSGAPAGAAIAR